MEKCGVLHMETCLQYILGLETSMAWKLCDTEGFILSSIEILDPFENLSWM